MVTKLQQLPVREGLETPERLDLLHGAGEEVSRRGTSQRELRINHLIFQSYQYINRGCPLAGNKWVQIDLANRGKIKSEFSQTM